MLTFDFQDYLRRKEITDIEFVEASLSSEVKDAARRISATMDKIAKDHGQNIVLLGTAMAMAAHAFVQTDPEEAMQEFLEACQAALWIGVHGPDGKPRVKMKGPVL